MNVSTTAPVYDVLIRMIKSMAPEEQKKALDCILLSLHEDAIQLGFTAAPGLRFENTKR